MWSGLIIICMIFCHFTGHLHDIFANSSQIPTWAVSLPIQSSLTISAFVKKGNKNTEAQLLKARIFLRPIEKKSPNNIAFYRIRDTIGDSISQNQPVPKLTPLPRAGTKKISRKHVQDFCPSL